MYEKQSIGRPITEPTPDWYNHLLATWAMELSYTAYNYPEGDWLFPIPGLFMGDVDKPATTFLTEHGFENVRDYNYDHDESVAHVVAHKNIMFSSHESEQENTEGDNENGISYNNRSTYSGIPGDTIYDGSSSLGLSISSDTTYNGLFPSVTSTASSSEESVSSDTRPLVVVDIRKQSGDGSMIDRVPVTGIAAHTIGHREITIINISTIGDDNNDNNSYDASNDGTDSGSNANLSTIGVADTFTGSTVSKSNEIRQLVVVSVRGSVSLKDWAIDLANQINLECINFETGY